MKNWNVLLVLLIVFFSVLEGECVSLNASETRMVAIVTGANRGIGLEFCKQLSERGYDVFAICRSSSTSLESISCNIIAGIDLTNDADILAMAERMKDRQIDLVINNAGIGLDDSFWDADRLSLMEQLNVNAVGSFLVTKALKGNLAKNAKIVMISSRMGSISTVQSKQGWRGELFVGYGVSKAALNMLVSKMALAFSEEKENCAISVLAIHPGYVKTDMNDHQGTLMPAASVKGMLEQIDKLSIINSGSFVQYDGIPMSW